MTCPRVHVRVGVVSGILNFYFEPAHDRVQMTACHLDQLSRALELASSLPKSRSEGWLLTNITKSPTHAHHYTHTTYHRLGH